MLRVWPSRLPLPRWLPGKLILLALGLFLSLSPALGQTPTPAPVRLDGHRLFEVTSAGSLSAEQRAEEASRILQQAVQPDQQPTVTVVETNQLLVIQVNDQPLLTVTSQDAPPGRTPLEQAQHWVRQIREALGRAKQERSWGYRRQALIWTGAILLGAFLLHWGLGWGWRRWLRRLIPVEAHRAEDEQATGVEVLYQTTLVLARAGVWCIAAFSVADLFPLTRYWSNQVRDVLWESFVAPLIPLGEKSYSVIDLVILVGMFLGLLVVARTATKLLRSRVLRVTRVSRGAQETVAFVANYGLILTGTLVLLQLWGLDLSSLTILLSVVGVGVGLGLQGIAKEFVSGLVIIFERPIQVGDFVEVGELQGTVERVSIRSTEIRTVDQLSIIIPNSRFLESEVINWSHRTPVSRLRLPVGVAYGSNPSAVRAALTDAAKDHPDVLSEPPPRVLFKGFGDNALNFELLVWIGEPRKQFVIKSDLYFRLEAILRHRHIGIPFPQRDVHVRSGNLPVNLSPSLEESLTTLAAGLTAWVQQTQTPNGSPSAPETDLPSATHSDPEKHQNHR